MTEGRAAKPHRVARALSSARHCFVFLFSLSGSPGRLGRKYLLSCLSLCRATYLVASMDNEGYLGRI